MPQQDLGEENKLAILSQIKSLKSRSAKKRDVLKQSLTSHILALNKKEEANFNLDEVFEIIAPEFPDLVNLHFDVLVKPLFEANSDGSNFEKIFQYVNELIEKCKNSDTLHLKSLILQLTLDTFDKHPNFYPFCIQQRENLLSFINKNYSLRDRSSYLISKNYYLKMGKVINIQFLLNEAISLFEKTGSINEKNAEHQFIPLVQHFISYYALQMRDFFYFNSNSTSSGLDKNSFKDQFFGAIIDMDTEIHMHRKHVGNLIQCISSLVSENFPLNTKNIDDLGNLFADLRYFLLEIAKYDGNTTTLRDVIKMHGLLIKQNISMKENASVISNIINNFQHYNNLLVLCYGFPLYNIKDQENPKNVAFLSVSKIYHKLKMDSQAWKDEILNAKNIEELLVIIIDKLIPRAQKYKLDKIEQHLKNLHTELSETCVFLETLISKHKEVEGVENNSFIDPSHSQSEHHFSLFISNKSDDVDPGIEMKEFEVNKLRNSNSNA